MALGSLVNILVAKGIGTISESMKRNKLEKKINSGIIELEDLLWLAGFYLDKKEYFRAESFAKKASELQPNDSGVKDTLFKIYFFKTDYTKAVEIVESLINDEKDGKEIAIQYFNLGYCYYKLRNFEKAEECKNKASEFDVKFRDEKYR